MIFEIAPANIKYNAGFEIEELEIESWLKIDNLKLKICIRMKVMTASHMIQNNMDGNPNPNAIPLLQI